jgi:hypothetical protein
MEVWELEEKYKEKYGIIISSNWSGKTILRKYVKQKPLFIQTGLRTEKIYDMMATGLNIGTNYLEDCMLAAGKKWVTKNPGIPKRGYKF